MSLWVVVEHDGGAVRKVSLELLGRGRELGAPTAAVVMGSGLDGVVEALGGAFPVLAVDEAGLQGLPPDAMAEALAQLVERDAPSAVVAGATSLGRDLMPRLAARLGVGLAAGCTALDRNGDAWTVRRPVQGGKAYVELIAGRGPALATVRPNTYTAPDAVDGAAGVERVQGLTVPAGAVSRDSFEPAAAGRVPIEEAEVVVCGGRGVGSAEAFERIEELADALGGAVGASRAVVDARWRGVEEQVGKSGKTVAPRLYFAVGISGAIHHTMGMDTSGTVVAINNDPNALMFQYADLGLVGDAAEVLPVLTERLRG